MSETASPAQAETPPTTDGAQPQAAETPTQTQTGQDTTPQAGDNLDDVRALLRANSGGLVNQPRGDNWHELDAEQEQAPDADPNAEAQPGAESQQTEGELSEEEKAAKAAEEADAKAKDEAAKAKNPNRIRINRFNADDQKILQRMAHKDGELSYDQARAELVEEGVIAKPDASSTAAPAAAATEKKSDATTAFEAKQEEVAELERQMKEAATAFDTPKLAELNIAHNKAQRELGKLESKVEAEQQARQAQEQTRQATVEEKSEAAAVAEYPDAAKPGTALYEALEDWLDDPANAALVQTGRYHLIAVKECATAIGYQPPAAAPAKAATPPIVPKKPSRPVPPGPASGASTQAPAARTPTPEQELNDAGNDPDKLKEILRRRGTPVGQMTEA